MRKANSLLLAAMVLALTPLAAQAYIGPGVGAGAIGAVLGVIGSIFLALFAVVYYPIKRLLKGRKPTSKNASPKDPGT